MITFFRRYQSIKRLGTPETEGIEVGKSYVFPKIDGTNAQCWFDGNEIQAGSRNRMLGESSKADNAGFCKFARANKNLRNFFTKHPNLRLYGEWLVPHSLKTYRDDAWKRFYVFDVVIEYEPDDDLDSNQNFAYLPYDLYKPMLEEFNLDYISPLGILKNASAENYTHYLDKNGFLIKDGAGNGEGVVIKNYDYVNRYKNIVWAKIVTNEFKETHYKTMGAPESNGQPIEETVASLYVTPAVIEKELSKIVHEAGAWEKKLIPRLLETIYYCVVTEETWTFVKKFNNPTINFRALRNFCVAKVKEIKPELFS